MRETLGILGSLLTLWIVYQVWKFYRRNEQTLQRILDLQLLSAEQNVRASELNERTAQLDIARMEKIISGEASNERKYRFKLDR